MKAVNSKFRFLLIHDNGVVIMSLSEYNSLMATNHELTSKVNEKRIDSAIENLSRKNTFSKELLMNID